MRNKKATFLGLVTIVAVSTVTLTNGFNNVTKEEDITNVVTDCVCIEENTSTRLVSDVATLTQTYAETNADWFESFKQQTVVSTGTNGRLDNFIQKLNNGEHVIVVAEGGSITEGVGSSDYELSYADRFVQGLKDRYPNAEIEYLNVGISATPSSIGIINYDKDVTLALQNRVPDLVLIEYAANDAIDTTYSAGYESMVRKALEKGDTAVMLVFSEIQSGYNKQETYIPIGDFYGLPMMSIKNALDNALAAGQITESQYFKDSLHPTDFGHYLMSEGLLEIIDLKQAQMNLYGATPVQALPTGYVYSTAFRHLNLLTKNFEVLGNEDGTVSVFQGTDGDCYFNVGSFNETDSEIRAAYRFDTNPFADNMQHETWSGNNPLTLTTTCRNIILNYKTSSSDDYGEAIVYLDGEFLCFINGYDPEGYNNSNAIVLLNTNESATHTLTIQMASSDKKFTILNLAYTK